MRRCTQHTSHCGCVHLNEAATIRQCGTAILLHPLRSNEEEAEAELVIFSNVLGTFQNFYRYTGIAPTTLEKIRYDFFYIFLRLLEDEGVNEYEDKEFEPESRIPGFDIMRLYYVAFSRAEKLLVLTGNLRRPPK